MKLRWLSIALAMVLQVVPVARVFTTTQGAAQCSYVMRLIVGAVASLGAFDAVSGGSTRIASPANATGEVAQAFSYRIYTVGHRATRFNAVPLPGGLAVNSRNGYITGLPTTPGETEVLLTASDGGYRTTKRIMLYILGEGGPLRWSQQPPDTDGEPGQAVTISSAATADEAIAYTWLFNGAPIPGSGPHLNIAALEMAHTGNYQVVASTASASITSRVATLSLRVPLLPSGSPWRYHGLGNNLRKLWRQANYDDTAWAEGNAPLGYGFGDETTMLPATNVKGKPIVTTYLRQPLVIESLAGVDEVKLSLQVDDGAVVYVNGVERWRHNLRLKGGVSFKKTALSGKEGAAAMTWVVTNAPVAWFHEGTNLIAVEVHQARPDGMDARFDLQADLLKRQ